ncbi:MAG TPA: LysE family translocator [Pyrinomonadaceae bacterium]|jgi:homoserine/homoserine lactone efflux protein
MTLKLLLLFAVTEFFVSLTPGPAVLLVLSQGMKAGFRPSVRGTLGIETANVIYFALSALGLGALLTASAVLFEVVRYVGAAYLVFIGIKMLAARGEVSGDARRVVPSARPAKLFWQGFVTQLSNPKAIVYFTSLLPQFVAPGGRVFEQFLVLGLVSVAVEVPVLLAYGWVAERGGRLLPDRYAALPDRIAGVFLVGAGVGLASIRKP